MASYQVQMVQDFQHPVEWVFEQLLDHERLGKILGVPVKRIHEGLNDVNGAGSIRRVGIWPLAIEETVLAVSVNQSISYRITRGGAPFIQHHQGTLTFSANQGGSRVVWDIQFESFAPLVGGLIQQILKHQIGRGLQRI